MEHEPDTDRIDLAFKTLDYIYDIEMGRDLNAMEKKIQKAATNVIAQALDINTNVNAV